MTLNPKTAEHGASSRLEQAFRVVQHFPLLSDEEQAPRRLQSGPLAGAHSTRRRATCRPGSSRNSFGFSFFAACVFTCPVLGGTAGVAVHSTHLATTAQLVPAGILGKRGSALDSAALRMCREAGVTTNVFVRDLDMGTPSALDGRRLEVVADGLPLHEVWCLHCTLTAHLVGWQPQQMVRFVSTPCH